MRDFDGMPSPLLNDVSGNDFKVLQKLVKLYKAGKVINGDSDIQD